MDALAALAETQHGVVTREQAEADGVSAAMIKHRLRTGRWEELGQGVYRVAGTVRTWQQDLAALTLAAGPGAAASHRSAAALLGIPGFSARVVEVTTPRPRYRRTPAGRVHRSRLLPPDHLTVMQGIVTTRVARTLVDLAGVLSPGRTERAVENCLRDGMVSIDALRGMTDELAKRGRTGIRLMRELLAERSDGYVAPASELEARFLRVVRRAGLPEPVRQLDVGDGAWVGRVDFAYPLAGVLIELDGRRYHSAKLDLESDRLRDNRLMAAGWRVLRVTWPQLHGRPDEVVALVRRALVRSGRGQGHSVARSAPRTDEARPKGVHLSA
jgi:very-short-patch-repair endonuclease